jgi:ATP-dependent DNA ligase
MPRVVCDSNGKPDFKALMDGATGDLCAWCFDLLEVNGRGIRRRTLIERTNRDRWEMFERH